MRLHPLLPGLMIALLLASAAELWAGNFTFQYRDAAGALHVVTNMRDVNRLVTGRDAAGKLVMTDTKAYWILKKYLDDVQTIKDRVKEMGSNIVVTVNASLAAANDPGSWSTGGEIQIQTWDDYRAVSTLAHEVGHSYMKDKCGKNPTDGMNQAQKYGADKEHYVNEITNPKTALSEGYAEYHGDVDGGGQEPVACAGSGELEKLKKEGAAAGSYTPSKWGDITSAADMWGSEGINAGILRDMAKYVPDGAAKIEEMMCQNTLQEVIKAWVAKYPGDAETVAKIVDANTNYTMGKEALRGLTGANNYIDKQRAGDEAKNKGKNPCDTLAGSGLDGGALGVSPDDLGGSGGGAADGGGTSPQLKRLR